MLFSIDNLCASDDLQKQHNKVQFVNYRHQQNTEQAQKNKHFVYLPFECAIIAKTDNRNLTEYPQYQVVQLHEIQAQFVHNQDSDPLYAL